MYIIIHRFKFLYFNETSCQFNIRSSKNLNVNQDVYPKSGEFQILLGLLCYQKRVSRIHHEVKQ